VDQLHALDFPEGFVFADDFLIPELIPFVDSHSVVAGGSSAQTTFNPTSEEFDVTVSQRCETPNASTGFSDGFIYFSVDSDVGYELDGTYAMLEPEGDGIVQQAGLTDLTTNTKLFFGDQASISTANESFVLGLQRRDFRNALRGSLTGTLTGGHEYEFYFGNFISGR
jgi:hypothetical protein